MARKSSLTIHQGDMGIAPPENEELVTYSIYFGEVDVRLYKTMSPMYLVYERDSDERGKWRTGKGIYSQKKPLRETLGTEIDCSMTEDGPKTCTEQKEEIRGVRAEGRNAAVTGFFSAEKTGQVYVRKKWTKKEMGAG